MGLFETVKNNVTTRQAAERYGLRVGHNSPGQNHPKASYRKSTFMLCIRMK